MQGGLLRPGHFPRYMRFAVANRPVEKFDTELKLPEWQLEPDARSNFGNPEDYYYVDEQGNLVNTVGPEQRPGDIPEAPKNQGGPDQAGPPPAAANDEFLNEATGGACDQSRAARR